MSHLRRRTCPSPKIANAPSSASSAFHACPQETRPVINRPRFSSVGATLGRSYFHLHLVSDSTGETLIAASRAASAQYQGVASIEHVYPLVRTPSQLDRVIAEIENAPGIVLFTLVDSDLSKRLEEGCEASGSPCLSVLGPILTLFKSYLGQNATPRAGAQHMLNADYFKRIDALNFSMISDDGLAPENLSNADIVLIGVSRTSKTPTSIYLANRGYKTANVPLVPHMPLPPDDRPSSPSVDRRPHCFRRSNRANPAKSSSVAQGRFAERICRSGRGRRGSRCLSPPVRRTWLADDRRHATVDRGDGGQYSRSLSRASPQIYCRRLRSMRRPEVYRENRNRRSAIWRGARPLILASKSRARLALLSAAGLDAEVVAADIDERALEDRHLATGGSLEALAIELARAKALAVSALRPTPIAWARIRRSRSKAGSSTNRAISPRPPKRSARSPAGRIV